MSKQEKTITRSKETEADFEARVEAAILKLRAENDGKMPTNDELNSIVRTSLSRLCPIRRKIVERLQTIDTRLSQMPEIPEELRLANEEALKSMWAKTRELQNVEIVDLKRVMQAREAEHLRTVEDLEGIISRIESELAEANRSVDESSKLIEQLRVELEETKSRLSDADARLAERDDLMDLLRGITPSAASAGEPKEPKRSVRAKKSDDTQDLPLK